TLTITLSLSVHDALPIWVPAVGVAVAEGALLAARIEDRAVHLLRNQHRGQRLIRRGERLGERHRVRLEPERLGGERAAGPAEARSEEHTSELQSRENLVC